MFAFLKNKKEKPSNILTNQVFGQMQNFKNWFTVNPVSITLWGRKLDATVFVVADGPQDKITSIQEDAGKMLFDQLELFQAKLEKMVEESIKCSDNPVFREMISIGGIYISKKGEIGVLLDAGNDDGELEIEEIGPEDTFGFCIYPQTQFYTSNEDFLMYFY